MYGSRNRALLLKTIAAWTYGSFISAQTQPPKSDARLKLEEEADDVPVMVFSPRESATKKVIARIDGI